MKRWRRSSSLGGKPKSAAAEPLERALARCRAARPARRRWRRRDRRSASWMAMICAPRRAPAGRHAASGNGVDPRELAVAVAGSPPNDARASGANSAKAGCGDAVDRPRRPGRWPARRRTWPTQRQQADAPHPRSRRRRSGSPCCSARWRRTAIAAAARRRADAGHRQRSPGRSAGGPFGMEVVGRRARRRRQSISTQVERGEIGLQRLREAVEPHSMHPAQSRDTDYSGRSLPRDSAATSAHVKLRTAIIRQPQAQMRDAFGQLMQRKGRGRPAIRALFVFGSTAVQAAGSAALACCDDRARTRRLRSSPGRP